MSTDKKASAPGRTGPIAHELGKIRVGRLPTMNQDEYPGLSGWWVQLRIGEDGEEVLARVYGNTPEQAHSRATALAAQPRQALTQQTLDDVKAGIPARDAEIEALRKQVETLQAQLVDRSPEMQGKQVDESPNLQAQQQPVSGADGLSEQTKWPVLKAMANNYIPGKHTWDHLDADACSKGAEEIRQLRAALAQQDEPKLGKPAKVGGARFGAGIKWSTVIAAAQRLYAYEVTPEKEAERIAGADQKMQALRHHLAAQAQQDADKVDAGIEAAAKALAECMDYPWEPMPEQVRDAMRKHVKTIIDAARKEQA